MKYATTVYKPSLLIRDIREPVPKYYRGNDVSWSPSTKIGDLQAVQPKPAVIRPRATAPKKALFHDVTAVTAVAASDKSGHGAVIIDNSEKQAYRLPHVPLLPKKYTLAKGVRTDLNTPTFRVSAMGTLLAMVLFGGLLATSPGNDESSSNRTPANRVTASNTVNTVTVPAQTSSAPATTGTTSSQSAVWNPAVASTGVTSQDTGNSPSSPAVGGYGGGGSTTGNTGTPDSGSTGNGSGTDSGSTDTGDGDTGSSTGSDGSGNTGDDGSTPIITIPPITVDPTGSTPIIQTGEVSVSL